MKVKPFFQVLPVISGQTSGRKSQSPRGDRTIWPCTSSTPGPSPRASPPSLCYYYCLFIIIIIIIITYIGPVTASSAEEHSAVIHSDRVSTPLDCLEEKLLGLGLPSRPLVALARPAPDLPALHTGQLSWNRGLKCWDGEKNMLLLGTRRRILSLCSVREWRQS